MIDSLKQSLLESTAEWLNSDQVQHWMRLEGIKDDDEERHIRMANAAFEVFELGSKKLKPKHPPSNHPMDWAIFVQDAEFVEAWNAYIEMRIKKKKPATDRAVNIALTELIKHSKSEVLLAIKLLDQSTSGGWHGIFPLKTQEKEVLNSSKGIPEDESEYGD